MPTLTKQQWAAVGAGAVGGLVVTAVGIYLKVRELGSDEFKRRAEAEIQRVAEAEGDRYIGAAWGLTPARIQAITRYASAFSFPSSR